MPTYLVTSDSPGAGKTGVAAALARRLAYGRQPTQLVRMAGESGNAVADATLFGLSDFVPGSPLAPAVEAPLAPAGTTLVVEDECGGGTPPAAETVIIVARDVPSADDVAAANARAVVLTNQTRVQLRAAPSVIGDAPVFALGEDRCLAGFGVDEIQAILRADQLVAGDLPVATSDHLVIAPIGSDAGQPYFRRFESPAVVVRFDKTDQHLAALAINPNVLILTGGRQPSGYLFDAASARGIPVLLSQTDTENTVIALEGIFAKTRFQGERKLDRMSTLLDEAGFFAALGL